MSQTKHRSLKKKYNREMEWCCSGLSERRLKKLASKKREPVATKVVKYPNSSEISGSQLPKQHVLGQTKRQKQGLSMKQCAQIVTRVERKGFCSQVRPFRF